MLQSSKHIVIHDRPNSQAHTYNNFHEERLSQMCSESREGLKQVIRDQRS